MPFILIQGTFHLVGRTQAGNPTGFEPDGDSDATIGRYRSNLIVFATIAP